MRHENRGNEIVRHYWLFDQEEVDKFRNMLRRHKAVMCISTITTDTPIAVVGSADQLRRFEDDVF